MKSVWSTITLIALVCIMAGQRIDAAPTKYKSSGSSISMYYNAGTQSINVNAGRYTTNGAPTVYLYVHTYDYLTFTQTCGQADIPASSYVESGQRVSLSIDLSTVTWNYLCSWPEVAPTGVINVSLETNQLERSHWSGSNQTITQTHVFHSNGTSQQDSATVTGQLLNVQAPPELIAGWISRSSNHQITIEKNE